MTKLLIGLLLLLSFSSMASTEIGRISERNSNRAIVMENNDHDKTVSFILVESSQRSLIKTISYEFQHGDLKIKGDSNEYHFEIFKKGLEGLDATTHQNNAGGFASIIIFGAFVSAVTANPLPLFLTIPVIGGIILAPVAVGIALAPVDGLLTVIDKTFDSENVASRKFKKMTLGKNKKASKKVFKILLERVSNL